MLSKPSLLRNTAARKTFVVSALAILSRAGPNARAVGITGITAQSSILLCDSFFFRDIAANSTTILRVEQSASDLGAIRRL
jgi:hypothetical protein